MKKQESIKDTFMVLGNPMENISDKEAVIMFNVRLGCDSEKIDWVMTEKQGLCFWQSCQEVFKTWKELGIE
jgi:hypothetical protein